MGDHIGHTRGGITGIAMPAIAWASHCAATADILLTAETVLVLFLVTGQYAGELLELVDAQRAAGVQCGLAVRDLLSTEQAVDFLVISQAAVSVQDDQATRGRTSVHFKNVDRWVRRHESIWGHGQLSATSALAAYEGTARPMLAPGSWDENAMRDCLSRLQQ